MYIDIVYYNVLNVINAIKINHLFFRTKKIL